MAASRDETPTAPPWLVAIAAWAMPGLGHVLIGQAWRGIAVGAAVLGLFIGGLLIGGVRVVDPPGYQDGRRLETRDGSWVLLSRPVGSMVSRPWFVAQVLNGPVAIAAGAGNVAAARAGYAKPTARLADIGTLYCAAAGMMNLIAVMDAASRAAGRES